MSAIIKFLLASFARCLQCYMIQHLNVFFMEVLLNVISFKFLLSSQACSVVLHQRVFTGVLTGLLCWWRQILNQRLSTGLRAGPDTWASNLKLHTWGGGTVPTSTGKSMCFMIHDAVRAAHDDWLLDAIFYLTWNFSQRVVTCKKNIRNSLGWI